MAASEKTRHKPSYEFGGPLGAFAITTGLPLLCYLFTFACNDVSGCPAPSLLSPSSFSLERLKDEVGWPAEGVWGLASWEATFGVMAYYMLSAVLYRVLPAQEVQGVVLECGGRLWYRFNSLSSGLFTIVVCAAGTVAQGADFPVWTFITGKYLQILTANIIIAYAISIFVYVRSFSVKPPGAPRDASDLRELVPGACTGNMIYDHYMGREKNPRVNLPSVGEIDLKEWCEVRPGLLGWLLLNCAFVAKQYRAYGFITDSIAFITFVQAIYVLDCWYNESAILTTIDITTDGFGFMLSFGDLVWVPFVYSLQTKYLSTYPVSLGPVGLASVTALLATGFYIFRSANSQKNNFRTNPNDPKVAHLKYIKTKTGSKLLITGWWGIARHINYLGDWIQAWPYSLPTGVAGYIILQPGALGTAGADFVMSDGREVVQGAAKGWGMVITYFYVLYFAVLLVHRDRRDDEKCHNKYGEDWEKYKKIVKYRIVPGIY